MTKRYPGPLPGSIRVGDTTAVAPVTGHRPNEVLWWHHCTAEDQGWVADWLKDHPLTGLAGDGTLTVHGVIICEHGCGRAGWITDMTWIDA